MQVHPTERAFIAGAVIAGGITHQKASEYFHDAASKSTITKLIQRVKARTDAPGLPISDPKVYETEVGRGRPELLTPEQKREMVKIATSDRQHREKEAWQAIADGDFDEIAPKMSISTFENVMYQAGYSRRKPIMSIFLKFV